MPRIVFAVNVRELEALIKLALAELRNPRDQARYNIRQERWQLNAVAEHLQRSQGDAIRFLILFAAQQFKINVDEVLRTNDYSQEVSDVR